MPALPSSLALTNIGVGAEILSADHRNNYSAVQTAVNQLITALSGGVSGQVLQATGASSVAYANGSTTYRKTTPKTVNTTTLKTDLLNGEITLAANDLSTNKRLTLRAYGDWKNNSGVAVVPPRIVFDLGGTTILDTGAFAVSGASANSVSRYGWGVEVTVAETGATNTQSVSISGYFAGKNNGGAVDAIDFTTGEGTYFAPASTSLFTFAGWNAGTKDGTGALAVALSTINGSASANYEVVLKDAMIVIE